MRTIVLSACADEDGVAYRDPPAMPTAAGLLQCLWLKEKMATHIPSLVLILILNPIPLFCYSISHLGLH